MSIDVMLAPMQVLQNRWYNGLKSGLGLEPSLFQISQPAPPLSSDSELWSYLNVIPPCSLTFNHALYSASLFFDQYVAVINPLLDLQNKKFEQDIGETNYSAWNAYVAQQTPHPTPAQLSTLFRAWAPKNGALSVASQGAADLTQMAYIAGCQQALQPYQGNTPLPVDYGTYQDLLTALAQSTGGKISFKSKLANGDITNTWTKGANDNFYGLWAGNDGLAPQLSGLFAAGQVSVVAACNKFLAWTGQPGNWYNSSLLHTAYDSHTLPSWNDMFGPNGTMLYAVASLVVADAATITVTCDYKFNPRSQATISQNAPKGLWPFFIPSGDTVSNTVTFDKQKGMTITTTTQPGNPIVLGANVLGISQYLGH